MIEKQRFQSSFTSHSSDKHIGRFSVTIILSGLADDHSAVPESPELSENLLSGAEKEFGRTLTTTAETGGGTGSLFRPRFAAEELSSPGRRGSQAAVCQF